MGIRRLFEAKALRIEARREFPMLHQSGDPFEHLSLLRSRRAKHDWNEDQNHVQVRALQIERRKIVACSANHGHNDTRRRQALRTGALVQVLTGQDAPGTPVQLVYPPRRQLPRRVRALMDFVVEALLNESALGQNRVLLKSSVPL